jgi:hypothetical protein
MAPTPPKKKHRSSQSTPSHYTLHVELLDMQPAIWRRIHIDGRARLDALHHVLQAAMGWSDSHLHQFEINNKRYGIPDPEYADPDSEMHDEKKYRLNQLLGVGATCDYLYDFGDSWHHRITVETIEDLANPNQSAGDAWIESGERACPPEDVGSTRGYQEMLDILENAPYGDEAKRLREWAGVDFDPERFDRQAANTAISRMLWNGWIKLGA